jgi:hypothetical protein
VLVLHGIRTQISKVNSAYERLGIIHHLCLYAPERDETAALPLPDG